MSNDPSQPISGLQKITGNISKQPNEILEIDLWDLDSKESDFENSEAPVSSEPAGLPEHRNTNSSNLQSRQPNQRSISVSNLELTKDNSGLDDKTVRKEKAKLEAEAADKGYQKQLKPDSEHAVMDETKAQPEARQSLAFIAMLSKVEKIAISCLFAALALMATLALIHFSNRIPTRPLVAVEIDYPVKGEIVEITAASTHWRIPVTGGENADVVRRSTQLIPVLKLKLSSPSGAVRIFFRNEDGVLIGDGITRTIKGSSELAIAATAGFTDIGMHTAYRTGDSKPWVVQIFEAPYANAPREKFRKLLEKNISPSIR